jgi:hypothetical protein
MVCVLASLAYGALQAVFPQRSADRLAWWADRRRHKAARLSQCQCRQLTTKAAGASVGGPLVIASSWMGHLWDTLCRAYDRVGFGRAAGGDEVFRHLVLARIIEPTSKHDSLRVLQADEKAFNPLTGSRQAQEYPFLVRWCGQIIRGQT